MVVGGRIERLRHVLASRDLGGAVICRAPNVRYLSGVAPDALRPGFLVLGPRGVVLVAAGTSASLQQRAAPGVSAIGYAAPSMVIDQVAQVGACSVAALEEALEQAGLAQHQIGVEEDSIGAAARGAIARRGAIAAIDGAVEAQRRIKDADELALIRAAVAANDAGFSAVRDTLAAGVSEFEVAAAVVRAMQEQSGVPIDVLDETNGFVSGPRTEAAIGLPTARRMARGDLLIVDLNPFVRGYKGDTTRTFCVGVPTAEQQRIHDVLVQALEAAEAIARPGTRACDVYAALADTIAASGYGAGFWTHGGHALGLEHVERPYIIPADEMPLEAGMVLAFEPGVYGPGFGGLRVEDNYLVTATGLERLSRSPRTLLCCD